MASAQVDTGVATHNRGELLRGLLVGVSQHTHERADHSGNSLHQPYEEVYPI